ncbi:MAG: Fe-S protein, radical SAM family [Candidatus Woesebacteria bacterium GW2011_GWB1_39_12]|uniref:Fe-S protein, radical SAM family n=1 Tax=Candidatus Woesebacteria bacterium GW2011_GWB1_39_12 TaxID=1618574 RepID=A0A0G0MMN9_9BACT|nr:MAG: Fe-S protein, radical SAM family [Candidatus Woesebacteria bacterium GW2011_GWB1_39_12]
MTLKSVVLVKPPNDLGPEHHSIFGLLLIASHLRKHQISFLLVNGNIDQNWKRKLDALASPNCVVAISALTPEIPGGIDASDIAKQHGATVIWGGKHAQLFHDVIAADKSVDYVCVGEGEEFIPDVIRTEDTQSINNMCFQDGEQFTHGPKHNLDINSIECPAYDLIPANTPSPWLNRRRLQAESSRGCSYRCEFCEVPALKNSTWRVKAPEKVVSDIEHGLNVTEATYVEFVDDNPFQHAYHMQGVANEILKRKLRFEWCANCRAEYLAIAHVDDDYLDLLYEAGLRSISVGGESGSQHVLNILRKGIKKEHLLQAAQRVANVHNGKMDASMNFFFGTPGETRADIVETIELFDDIKTIFPRIRIGVNIYTPYPGTALAKGLWDEPATLRDWLDPKARHMFTDRFGGKHWQDNPEFYTQLAHYSGLLYSPPSFGKIGDLQQFMRTHTPLHIRSYIVSEQVKRKAYRWLHAIKP